MLRCKPVETEAEYNAVCRLRYQVYCIEKQWLPAKAYPGMLEKDIYDASAVHFMALQDGELVGTVRLITQGPFPIERHPGLTEGIVTGGSAEVSRLVFAEKHRNLLNSLYLYREAYRYSRRHRIGRWLVVAEPVLLRALRIMGFSFSPLGKTVAYFGGATLPADLYLDAAKRNLEQNTPQLYQWFEGRTRNHLDSFMKKNKPPVWHIACAACMAAT